MSSALKIDPTKFTVYDYDLSDCSDTEIDEEEWVTISSSFTVSTASTLPRHLVLRPNSQRPLETSVALARSNGRSIRTSSSHTPDACHSERNHSVYPRDLGRPSTSHHQPLSASDAQTIETSQTNTSRVAQQNHTTPPSTTNNQLHPQPTSFPRPVTTLHTHIPTLTSIYITPPTSLTAPTPLSASTSSNTSTSHLLPLLPISHCSPPLIQLYSPSLSPLPPIGTSLNSAWGNSNSDPETKQETYLRLCSSCFTPQRAQQQQQPQQLSRDRSGSYQAENDSDSDPDSDSDKACSVHSATFSNLSLRSWLEATATSDTKSRRQEQEQESSSKTSGRCTHGPTAACPGCPVPASARTADEGKAFLVALRDAVAPLNRAETERSGIRVFDMTSTNTGSGEVYVHKEGYKCKQ